MTQHNYLQSYDTAIAGLVGTPDSLVLMHQAVLALARAGALDFAFAEYERYGLGAVIDIPDKKLLEDIMALKGRLYKDMALRANSGRAHGRRSSDTNTDFAQQSTEAYARAFAATGGYFSGINVAAMSLLAGGAEDSIAALAKAKLDLLPNEKTGSKEDTYYIEATRAEALLLMGHKNKAGDILQDAVMHDPLNYTAHATTLKQFRMIMSARGQSADWLEPFTAPTAAHYAGYLFSLDPEAGNHLNAKAQKSLRAEISEQIQRHDIGFGYGALAAGADILIAETLLQEGAEIHIILPVPIDQFIATSVTPFGAKWGKRFDQCLEQASSVTICNQIDCNWPDKTSTQFASQTAMGCAVMRADTLFTNCHQLLIWNESDIKSATATDALLWREAGRKQTIIPYPGDRKSSKKIAQSTTQSLMAIIYVDLSDIANISSNEREQAVKSASAFANNNTLFSQAENGIYVGFNRAGNAADFAITLLSELAANYPQSHIQISGHYAPLNASIDSNTSTVSSAPTDSSASTGSRECVFASLKSMAAQTLPGETYVSETFAASLALFNGNNYAAEYVGTRDLGTGSVTDTDFRLFHLTLPAAA